MSERQFRENQEEYLISVAVSEMLEDYGKQLTEEYEQLKKNNLTCYNDYFAISLDTYNKKEYIMYSVGDAVIEKERTLGEFLFDFSDVLQEQNRENVVDEYLSYFPEMNKECLLTDKFFEIQKHLSLNEMHRYSSFQILKQIHLDNTMEANNELRIIYIEDKLYVATDFNLYGLFRYYLDEIYAAGLFPRRCMSCGSLFLSGKKWGNVLCGEKCRKKQKVKNTKAYYNRLDFCEVEYSNIYRKWVRRIGNAKEKHTISEDGITRLCQELQEFIAFHRKRKKECKAFVHSQQFQQTHYMELMNYDSKLYHLFDELKNNSPGVKKG